MNHAALGRRALILGAAGVSLTGCSGSSEPATKSTSGPSATSSSGPIIHGQDAGTVILDEDVDALLADLNAALDAGDARAMAAVIPGLPVRDWERRIATLREFPMQELRFAADRTFGRRQSNASGGAITVDFPLFLIHQVEGADGLPIVQEYRTEVTKTGPTAPLELHDLSGPSGWNHPAPWDLRGDWEVLTAEHVVLAFRSGDRAAAQRWLEPFSVGVGRAMAMVPAPEGAEKMLVTMDFPDSPLFLRGNPPGVVRDRAGFATRAVYLDPDHLTSQDEIDTPEIPFGTSRIVVHPAMVHTASYAIELAAHETAHGLAQQWGIENSTWITEGFATWVEYGGGPGLLGREGGTIRAAFPAYRARMKGREGLGGKAFQARNVNENYLCSGAVLAYVEAKHGRKAVLTLTAALYDMGSLVTQRAFKRLGWADLQELLARTEAWL